MRQPESTARASRARLIVLALISAGTMINYLDRTVIGIAAPRMSSDLGLHAAQMGLVFSAFSWTYTAAQIPGGSFLDRFGSRLTYLLSVVTWSTFVALQGLTFGLTSLLLARFGLGVAEAPCFPANSRIVATWFPKQERARATGIYTVGEYVGLAFLSPPIFWMVGHIGWRAPFFLMGTIGCLFGLVWWRLYREPRDQPRANRAELDHIAAGGGLADGASQGAAFSWRAIGGLLRHRQIWGAAIGQFAGNATLVFFLTWFPTYLATERGMAWVKVGIFATLPFIAASVGVLFGGWVSDLLVRRTGSTSLGRKLPIIAGLLMASSMILANYVKSDAAVIAVLAVAFFGQGFVGLGWTVISDMAPANYAGLTGGLFNFVSNLAGIVTPLAIGLILAATGSFAWALVMISATAMVGALSYIFLLGDIRRIEMADGL